jgi:hypothetical protein
MDRIDEVGYRAWDEYYSQMERRFRLGRGRKQYWGHRYYKTFRDLAERCLKYDIVVTDFIITNFEAIQKNHTYITPRDFAGDDAFDRYSSRVEKLGSQIGTAWTTQVDRLASIECDLIPDIYDSEESLLADVKLPFYPWFRVLYPLPFSEDLFMLYGQATWTQLQEDMRLRQYLRKQTGANVIELEARLGKLSDAFTEE